MMKHTIIGFAILALILTMSQAVQSSNNIGQNKARNKEEVEVIISDKPFDKMMAVLLHKRCVNCHPDGDIPLQGEDSHLHHFDIERGPNDHGLAGYTCETCHSTENNIFSGVPGAPHWALAPRSMAWEGKSRVEIAQQMMDPARNGGRSPKEIEKHLTEHELVLWAWDPGVDAEGIEREKPPVSKEDFIEAVKQWIADGAIIPDK